jgi:hypothetical protein
VTWRRGGLEGASSIIKQVPSRGSPYDIQVKASTHILICETEGLRWSLPALQYSSNKAHTARRVATQCQPPQSSNSLSMTTVAFTAAAPQPQRSTDPTQPVKQSNALTAQLMTHERTHKPGILRQGTLNL